MRLIRVDLLYSISEYKKGEKEYRSFYPGTLCPMASDTVLTFEPPKWVATDRTGFSVSGSRLKDRRTYRLLKPAGGLRPHVIKCNLNN